MFDSIVFKNAVAPGPLVDIGGVAEALLFYGRVALVANRVTLKDVLRRISPYVLLSLMQNKRIEVYYMSEQLGVSSMQQSDGRFLQDLVRFSFPDHTIEEVGASTFEEAAGATREAKLGASRFSKLLRSIDYIGFDQLSVIHALTDNAATLTSVKSLIQTIAPGFAIPADLRFNIERETGGLLFVDTNIDFTRLNAEYHRTVPPAHSSVTESYILALLQGAYEATYLAGALNSEIAVQAVERAVQARAIEAIVNRRANSEFQITSFTELTLANGHSIREAVNSGAVPFAAVVKLLDAADKFRHWLHQQPADGNLMSAYYREVVKDSWVEKLPSKSVRWGLFTLAGMLIDANVGGVIGTTAGVAVSAVDSFLLDKLIKGWKPHQFIEGEFRSLFAPEDPKQQ